MKKSLLIFSFILLMASLVQAQIIKGNYAIKNVQTGMLLRVKDASGKNGTPLVAYDPQNWKCMTWDFKNVDGNTYQLLNLFTSKTFQPKKDPRCWLI
ncbi:RICIN domain-containing protein [Pedobacter fastidiosus]|uniref:RICIN domain-containing protein n=1 Tax=Pedobacter fastidiosus TaxID=2765361 RepID=UPI00360A453B